MERIRHPQKLGNRLGDPDERDASFVVLFDGWFDDLERLHGSLRAHLGPRDWELVVVDNPEDDAASQRIATLEGVKHLPLRDRVGFAGGRNLGLRVATGRAAVTIDTSVELTGDLLAAVDRHLGDEGIGLVGRWGVVSQDGYEFTESDGPDVDGVEAYLIACRRTLLREVGLFHKRFGWYRNADLDFSFQVRDAGYRTVVDTALPVRRHEHRLWEATPPDERDEASRRNFFRFRDHWGDRTDLFVRLR
jgi:GT2 family glycosyltransferase